MEEPKSDSPKLPDMVMCGDHPSFTKTELNAKSDAKINEKDTDKLKEKVLSYGKIIPSGSRTERTERSEQPWARACSEHVLRLSSARRRVRSLELAQRPDADVAASGNRALVQVLSSAALGSFRWPPYLLCVWVVVLLLTHVLHCLVSLMERALPTLRKCTQFFRAWTEETWHSNMEMNQRVYPVALALVTALLYVFYYALYAAYTVVLWAIEPMCGEPDEESHCTLEMKPKVTDYEDELKTNSTHKT